MKKLSQKTKDCFIIKAIVKPGARYTEIEEVNEDTLKIKLKSLPQKGEANRELIEILADYFNIAKSRLQIIKGHGSKHKVIKIEGDIV